MSRGALDEKNTCNYRQHHAEAIHTSPKKPTPSRDTVPYTFFSQEPTSLLPYPGAPRGFLLPPVREDLFGLHPVGFAL